MCVEMFHDQHPQTIWWRTDFLFHRNFTPVTVVHYCIRHQCFILLPNVWVVFKIYFAIPHKIVAINNVQQSIKQAKGKKIIVLLHYIRLATLHIWVICFEHMTAWKSCSDMRKVCGNIFEDCKRHNVQLNLNVHQRFSQILWLYDDIYIGICWIFESIGMLAYRESFCYAVNLKFVQMLL